MRSLCLLLLILALAMPAVAKERPPAQQQSAAKTKPQKPTKQQQEFATTLRAIMTKGRLDELRWPNFTEYRERLQQLYERSNFAPLWLREGKPTPQARQMIQALQQAAGEGLDPREYDAPHWAEWRAHLFERHTTAEEVRFDAALSICTMRYVSDLSMGRINPRTFNFSFRSPRKLDLAEFIYTRLVNAANVDAALERAEPPFTRYAELRKALAQYREMAKHDDDEQLPLPDGMVFRGMRYHALAHLARKLRITGDLPADAVVESAFNKYDGALATAVAHFQHRHGLLDDGTLDERTVDQLNIPLRYRVEQIEATMERYRWLHYDDDPPPIVINIPESRLVATDPAGNIELTMRIDVGDEMTPTPIFEDNMESVVFRPYWLPPRGIQHEEIVPALKDPDYAVKYGFELIDQKGNASPAKLTDAALRQLSNGELRVRQRPGPLNALGLVKFGFPNAYAIELHDTPTWGEYFQGPERSISHGCIHLEKPAELAAWVLRDQPEWTLERIRQAMKSGPDDFKIDLDKPIPVLFFYATVVPQDDGTIFFYRDLYGHDAALIDALANLKEQ